MPTSKINFFCEDTTFKPSNSKTLKKWIEDSISQEGLQLQSLNFIFCSDDFLLDINRNYLSHDYLTDIITFNQSDDELVIEGDIFISIDRVKSNALSLNLQFENELARIVIHGVLHLIGYNDKTPSEKDEMTQMEDNYLSQLLHNKL